jgi:hypothetical protein
MMKNKNKIDKKTEKSVELEDKAEKELIRLVNFIDKSDMDILLGETVHNLVKMVRPVWG